MAKHTLERCSKRFLYDSWHDKQCSKYAIVEREGKLYCKVHDPENIKAKNNKKYAEYEAELNAKKEIHRKLQVYPELLEVCKEVNEWMRSGEKKPIELEVRIQQAIAKAEGE